MYIPDHLRERAFLLDGSVVADIADAERGINDLNHRAAALVDTEALARLLLRAESVASSRIEGLVVGPRRLLRADAARESGEPPNDVTAAEVLANIDAMAYAAGAIHESEQIAPDHLLEVHRRLLAGTSISEHAGRLREVQNWIGGSDYNPCTAVFVPPPPGMVHDLIVDLCGFCNNDALPAVAQAAIAHAQFETIHPFVDGNGRVGRALIHMVLRRRGLARRVLPPVSLILATRARDYVTALTATRYRGDPNSTEAMRSVNDWIGLFAGACTRAAREAEGFEARIAGIQAEWRERLGAVRAHSAVNALIKILPGAPVLTVKSAVALTKRSLPAVNEAITRLIDAGVLEAKQGRSRNRTFEARDIIEAFVELERQLASPAGDTRVEAPVRSVPDLLA